MPCPFRIVSLPIELVVLCSTSVVPPVQQMFHTLLLIVLTLLLIIVRFLLFFWSLLHGLNVFVVSVGLNGLS